MNAYRREGVEGVRRVCGRTQAIAVWVAALTVLGTAVAGFADPPDLRVIQIPIKAESVSTSALTISGSSDSAGTPVPRGTCPPVVLTLSDANFGGGSFVLEAGFVAGEIAAASYTIPPAEFPVILNLAEMVFAQQGATVTTTTQWSMLVWEGVPSDINPPIRTFSSDGIILPPVVMPPGTQATLVQVSVDPADPNQIVIQDNGTGTFSVGFRVDQHNNPPTLPCNIGLTPPQCCPPPTSSNAFPTVDPGGLQFGTQNWLRALDNCGPVALPGGWHASGSIPLGGDWNIRVTYTPFTCASAGACCSPGTGGCAMLFLADCQAQGGVFQGQGTTCTPNPCPVPTGACCLADGTCQDLPQVDCGAAGGTWLGVGVPCTPNPCPQPMGACCFGPASCLDLSQGDCTLTGGTWQGAGTACVGGSCPLGACCLPDGTCADGVAAGACVGMGGTYQGDLTQCAAVNCPQPLGACCLSNGNCLVLTETNCLVIPLSNWAGALTDCSDGNMNGTADACEAACAGPDGDVNADLSIDGLDVEAFVSAVLGTPAPSETCHGDFNASGGLDTGDIAGLVAALLGP